MADAKKYDLLLTGGKVFVGGKLRKFDIAIKGEKIAALGHRLNVTAGRRIKLAGKIVLPGAIDAHVHFQLPVGRIISIDDFSSGSVAAACGGITTFIDFAIQKKGQSLLEAIKNRRMQADGRVAIDYSLHAVPTDWTPRTVAEFAEAVKQGITSFKIYLIYKEQGVYSNDAALYAALETAARAGGLITVHAESADLLDYFVKRYHTESAMKRYGAYAHFLSRPAIVEVEAVNRAVLFAGHAGGRLYIVHMSAKDSVSTVRRARRNGVFVFAETCPHYLVYTEAVLRGGDGYLYATAPQIKTKKDQDALWRGLADGTISVIATDDCGFSRKQKSSWRGDFTKIPCGLSGVETMLPLIYTYGVRTGRISLNRMVQALSTNPAKLFGLYPKKGIIAVDADADLAIIDPERKTVLSAKSLHSRCDWSPYEGKTVWGVPEITISRGKIIVLDGEFVGSTGHGKFLKRRPPAPAV